MAPALQPSRLLAGVCVFLFGLALGSVLSSALRAHEVRHAIEIRTGPGLAHGFAPAPDNVKLMRPADMITFKSSETHPRQSQSSRQDGRVDVKELVKRGAVKVSSMNASSASRASGATSRSDGASQASKDSPKCAQGALQFSKRDCSDEKNLVWVGNPTYGGWKVCMTSIRNMPRKKRKGLVVYGFGVGTNTSWDEALINDYGVPVHAFDPTPKSIAYVQNREELQTPMFKFSAVGIGDADREETWNIPRRSVSQSKYNHQDSGMSTEVEVRSLTSIMKERGHTYLDICKIDVEGAEYEVLISLLEDGGCLPTNQLLMETHSYQVAGLQSAHVKTKALLGKAGFKLVSAGIGGHEHTWIRFQSRP
ncbi:Methyltransferase-like protein 24 [Porphyridium purpureum]|uniref:Methyltransferase-like protein 24 n=1 Tax=Porphyridium purpureum TaxID=35688 RepID=A0A5J4YS67_PORPP|nr:Methyltransferase-like protein 24 [Porphyridium purpureum]|eukprot:POR2702..scf236_6